MSEPSPESSNVLEEEWKTYELQVLSPNAGSVQRTECRQAFYAGAVTSSVMIITAANKSAEQISIVEKKIFASLEKFAAEVEAAKSAKPQSVDIQPAGYTPPGMEFFDLNSNRIMRLVTDGPWKDWIAYKYPDGQWVRLRMATDADKESIVRVVSIIDPTRVALPPDIAEQIKLLRDYVIASGAFHDDDCPGDSTCNCSKKPMNDAVNALCKMEL